jgi:hypothetical protein
MRVSLLVAFWLIGSLLCAAPESTEKEIKKALFSRIVDLTSTSLEQWNQLKVRFREGDSISHHYCAPARVLAWVYKTSHPENPYYGDSRVLRVAIEMGNTLADRNYKGQGHFEYHGEWPFYNLCQTYELLKEELPEESRRLWRDYADFYMKTRGRRPMFYTAFNHEAGNVAAVLRAGQVFGVTEWVDRAKRLMHQLVKVQRELGYFDEGPHHGPSMGYNHIQLTNMLLYVDYSGDQSILPYCKRLADFMIRYSFPDGSSIGAFDGRQSWGLGKICYGLDRWPKGKELNRRVFRSWKKWELLEPGSRYAFSTDMGKFWNGYWLVDEYLSLLPDAGAEPLPQDLSGYRMVESGPTFSGGLVRKQDWMVAVSAILSDIAHLSGSVYRLDRQSRLDIWHEDTGLVVGGGSNRVERGDVPLTNVILLTGYRDVDANFGKLEGGNYLDKRATYFPRALEADLTTEQLTLHESFGQGDIQFKVHPQNNRVLTVSYKYDVFSFRTLFLQLPLIVFHDSEVIVDGTTFAGDRVKPVKQNVQISNPITGTRVKIEPPKEGKSAVRPFVEPLRSYGILREKQYHQPYYQICLLSARIDAPEGKGSGEFRIEIANLR